VRVHGLIERVGEHPGACDGRITQHVHHADGRDSDTREALDIPDHATGFRLMGEHLADSGQLPAPDALLAIGHRVVHGGERFTEPARIDADVIAAITELVPLAPLHNPAALMGIKGATRLAPNVPQVAVFDTAFHHTLPEHAWRYALPAGLSERHHIRRYGFHGISCRHVSRKAAAWLGAPIETLNLIVLHLGNGASITAIAGGRSVETSMGMTPLEGLVMGTRSGDLDPAIVPYLMEHEGLDHAAIDRLMNRASGLKALCGTNDMREILARSEAGDAQARLALDVFAHRARKYIGAYTAVLGRVDALVFTGGIGQHAAGARAAILRGLEPLGYRLDPARNTAAHGDTRAIHADSSPARLLAIATNEELEIAREALACLGSAT
jgi:acetate kinase